MTLFRSASSRAGALVQRIGARCRAELAQVAQASWLGAKQLIESQDLTYASSIAFYALLSLFPFLLLAFSLLGFVASDAADRQMVADLILRYFPQQFAFLTSQLDAMRSTPLSLGVAGTAGLIWAALGVFGVIRNAVNLAWGITPRTGFVDHRVQAFVMLLASMGLLSIVVLVASARSIVGASWFASVLRQVPGLTLAAEILTGVAVRFATSILLATVVSLVLYFVPDTKVRVRDIVPGAILASLLWQATLRAFAWYASDISRFTQIHGSIAGVVVFLIWIYLSAVILLYGVEVTAACARLRGWSASPRSTFGNTTSGDTTSSIA